MVLFRTVGIPSYIVFKRKIATCDRQSDLVILILDCKKLRFRSKAKFHILSAENSAPSLNG